MMRKIKESRQRKEEEEWLFFSRESNFDESQQQLHVISREGKKLREASLSFEREREEQGDEWEEKITQVLKKGYHKLFFSLLFTRTKNRGSGKRYRHKKLKREEKMRKQKSQRESMQFKWNHVEVKRRDREERERERDTLNFSKRDRKRNSLNDVSTSSVIFRYTGQELTRMTSAAAIQQEVNGSQWKSHEWREIIIASTDRMTFRESRGITSGDDSQTSKHPRASERWFRSLWGKERHQRIN